jgi:DNA sulfur modification protein DndE
MVIKQFKLSQPEKDKLIRIKARTGIQNWNVLCRWAFCWSLSEPSIPGGIDPLSDSNVEMSWITFAGEYHEVYESLLKQKCIRDGVGDSQEILVKYFRLHLNRGINHFSAKDVLHSCIDLIASIVPKMEK